MIGGPVAPVLRQDSQFRQSGTERSPQCRGCGRLTDSLRLQIDVYRNLTVLEGLTRALVDAHDAALDAAQQSRLSELSSAVDEHRSSWIDDLALLRLSANKDFVRNLATSERRVWIQCGE